ncbi:MAG: hypothetical protein R3F08_08195 [Dokdonella sp.]|nr:hypothetical protein [Dokdonella sp.]MCB1570133.1 hypothetical protein [Xanthomonadales bacterium]MCB1573167.1 hypothetical protein [Xanthomonadales bacterium]MCB1579087.1 hypothetical protein [Xanthomonadales bacterium]
MALIAVECEIPGVLPRTTLERGTSGILADAVAHELAAQVAEMRVLDFVFVGALYDQAQLLRPGWPLHAALTDALDRLPRDPQASHVVALGSHEGRLPLSALEPERDLLGSPMLVMPWLLAGPAEVIGAVGQQLERELLDSGLIGAELALALGEAFGVKTAHARHMTTLDLCALACAQYEHAGLGAIWQVIETALLRPGQTQTVRLDDSCDLRYAEGVVRCEGGDRRRITQTRAILAAHGIDLLEADVPA